MKIRYTPKFYQIILPISLSIVLFSCGNKPGEKGISSLFSDEFVNVEAFKNGMSKVASLPNTKDSAFQKNLLKDVDLNVNYTYSLVDYTPIWFDESGLKKDATDLLRQLNGLSDDGLNASDYQVARLQSILSTLDKSQQAASVDSVIRWDRDFTKSYLSAAKDLLLGAKDFKKGDSLWFAKNDTLFSAPLYIANALKAENPIPALDTFRPAMPQYQQMKKALAYWKGLHKDATYVSLKKNISLGKVDSNLQMLIQKELPNVQVHDNDSINGIPSWIATYQYYHHIKPTGKHDSTTFKSLTKSPEDYIKTLQANLERLRALPRQMGAEAEYVYVNIPLMEVDYFREKALKFHGKVVVGKKSRQTPSLWANMANVVFNPPWGVPPTILKNDVGPGVSRSGAGYLARKGLRAFDSKGRDVTSSVNGSNYRKFSYRQPPGAHNSLGEVKFNLPNKWDIYLHDTPHRENFVARYRALSSGCVRVQNPKLLAEAILEDRQFSPEKIDSIIQTRRTKFEQLKRHLPVYIVYVTVAPDSTGNQLRYLDDVYGRDAKMKKAFYN